MDVGGNGETVVAVHGAGGAAAVADAAAAAGVSGNLTNSKNATAEKTPIDGQEGLRRGPSVQYTAGGERAGGPNGGNRKANEEAPVTKYVRNKMIEPRSCDQIENGTQVVYTMLRHD